MTLTEAEVLYKAGEQAFAHRLRGEPFDSHYGHAGLETWSAGWNDARDAFIRETALADLAAADAIGASVVPARYAGNRECIDQIRDRSGTWLVQALRAGCAIGDAAFAVHCMSCAFKYRFRVGKKDVEVQEIKKAEWYEAMFRHLCGEGPDPRSARPGFTAYVRPDDVCDVDKPL